jgi:hypothetical protein
MNQPLPTRNLIVALLMGTTLLSCESQKRAEKEQQEKDGTSVVSRFPTMDAFTAIEVPRDSAAFIAKLDSLLSEATKRDSIFFHAASGAMVQRARLGVVIEAPPSPIVQMFADGDNWMLRGPLVYRIWKTPLELEVPVGFVTDFASVPKRLRSFISSTGPEANAAVVHDYLYWMQPCTRLEADNLMAIAMEESKVGPHTASVIYQAVTRFGRSAWNSNKAQREQGLVRTVPEAYASVPVKLTWAQYRDSLHRIGATSGVEPAVPDTVCKIGKYRQMPPPIDTRE